MGSLFSALFNFLATFSLEGSDEEGWEMSYLLETMFRVRKGYRIRKQNWFGVFSRKLENEHFSTGKKTKTSGRSKSTLAPAAIQQI